MLADRPTKEFVLITYYFGDEAGQGFLHGSAGIVLMIVALFIFFLQRLHPGADHFVPGRSMHQALIPLPCSAESGLWRDHSFGRCT